MSDKTAPTLSQKVLPIDARGALDLRLSVLDCCRGGRDAVGGFEQTVRVVDIPTNYSEVSPTGVIFADNN